MVKKHFFPELSGDLWGVICYHHWYPRASLEGPENYIFQKQKNEVKKRCRIPPEYFPCGGSARILTWSWFINFSESHIFAIFKHFWAFLGPLGPILKNMVKKQFSPTNVWGPLGGDLLRLLLPKSRFRASEQVFFEIRNDIKNDAELPPEYFPCVGFACILTWSWFINFWKSHMSREGQGPEF